MELVKREDHWALYNEDGHKIAATIPGCNSKLSIKNCEAIANGYDLDELEELAQKDIHNLKPINPHPTSFFAGYRRGFQKALEIKKDKNFSEEDIRKAFNIGWLQRHNEKGSHYEIMEKVIQSLQQTEWDVVILMGTNYRHIDCVDVGEHVSSKIVKDNEAPMLDKDGCLILKRK